MQENPYKSPEPIPLESAPEPDADAAAERAAKVWFMIFFIPALIFGALFLFFSMHIR